VPRHRMVLVEALEYTCEPFAYLRHRLVHARSKRLLDLLQFRLQALPRRLPADSEVARAVDSAIMRESQERETLRLSFPTRCPVAPSKPAELDQPRFLGVQLQPKLR
ncbi:MAG: hypothetical protein WAN08_23385, partial [Candidatus Sulfotelmatobacter sp.]